MVTPPAHQHHDRKPRDAASLWSHVRVGVAPSPSPSLVTSIPTRGAGETMTTIQDNGHGGDDDDDGDDDGASDGSSHSSDDDVARARRRHGYRHRPVFRRERKVVGGSDDSSSDSDLSAFLDDQQGTTTTNAASSGAHVEARSHQRHRTTAGGTGSVSTTPAARLAVVAMVARFAASVASTRRHPQVGVQPEEGDAGSGASSPAAVAGGAGGVVGAGGVNAHDDVAGGQLKQPDRLFPELDTMNAEDREFVGCRCVPSWRLAVGVGGTHTALLGRVSRSGAWVGWG